MLHNKKIQKTLVLQKDQSDCGVACLLSLLKYYGGDSSLEKLRELSGTSITGTTMLGLYQAAEKIGFIAEGNEADIEALIEHGKPLILHVLIDETLEHYIVCYGFSKNGNALIGDPAEGIKEISKDKLNKIWQSKICLTLESTNKIQQAKTIKQNKTKWILSLLEKDKKLFIFSTILGLGMAVLGMTMSIFSQKLIDEILPSKQIDKLIGGIILLTVLLLARVIMATLRESVLNFQSKQFNNRITDYFYSNLLQLPKPFFDTRKIGELTARLNDTSRIQRVLKLLVSNVVIDVLMLLVSLGFLFYYSTVIACITLFSLPIYFYLIYRYNSRIIQSQKEVMQSYAMSESNYIQSIQGISEIKVHNKYVFFNTLNKNIFGIFQEKLYQLGQLYISISLFSGIASVLFLVGILTYTAVMVLHKEILLGELMAILGISSSVIPSITNLALISIPLNEAKIAFDRMFEFTFIDKEKTGNTEITEFYSLQMKAVDFRFAGRSLLLQNINLEVKKNECIAIIGESGCGKSTISQIIQQFYEIEKGNIIINSAIEFKDINVENWRNLIGVIPQEIHLFNGTVLDNILLGEEYNEEFFKRFIEENQLEGFINSLPQNIATIVGEEGINLSGGQKQMIALMRVLYKKPKLLILDEPSAAMDRNTEKFMIELLIKKKQEMSIILISHRLHSLKDVTDTIYIVENKSIIHKGNHFDLMKTKNFYSEI